MGTFFLILRRAIMATQIDGCLGTAKAAAYSGLLCLFPVLTSITTLLAEANAKAVSSRFAQILFDIVPPGTQELILQSVTVTGTRPMTVIFVATGLSIWGASGLMASLMEGFQSAYKLPSGRPLVKQRVVAIMLVVGTVLPIVAASALVLFGDQTERSVLEWLGVLPEGNQLRGSVVIAGLVIRYLVEFGTIIVVMGVMYYFGPNRKQRWDDILPGACMATFLWLLATQGFAWYVRNLANYNVLYGSIGGVIALLVWIYLLSVIVLFGCQFNAERERLGDLYSVN